MLTVNRKQPENKSELEEAYNALNQMFLKATQEVNSKEEIKEEKETKTTNYVRKDLNCY